MRVTTKDIARVCGVSIGSVDRALNNRSGINALTKAKILRVSREMGYRPDIPARSLVTGRSMAIGLVMPHLDHPALVQVATAVMHEGHQKGYFVHLTVSEGDPEIEIDHIDRLAGLNVDGYVLMTVAGGDRAFDQHITALNRPTVFMGNHRPRRWCSVAIDQKKAAYEAVASIVTKGYRRIVYVSPGLVAGRAGQGDGLALRYQGFQEGVRQHLSDGSPTVIRDQDYLQRLDELDFNSERTALFCAGDFVALEVLSHLCRRGVSVPQDVGLMGFGKADFIRFVRPLLATVDWHAADMARQAVECLVGQIDKSRAPSHITIEHRVVPGETL